MLIGILVAWPGPMLLTAAAAADPAPQPPSSAPARGNNDDQAAASIGRACDNGDGISCRNLGLMYAGGRGVTKDEARAVQLYQRSCDLGELSGCTNLAFMYELARGVAKDEARAVALYQRMCDDSTTVGCVNLGRMYEFGRGVEKDESRARGLYERLCDGKVANGCVALGSMYEGGRGVKKDEVRAAMLYARLCEGTATLGCVSLGRLYESGRGVSKDETRAAGLYQKACEAGSANGCAYFGVMLAAGRGTAKDQSRAVALYQRACNAGDTFGCRNLSAVYASGGATSKDAPPSSAVGLAPPRPTGAAALNAPNGAAAKPVQSLSTGTAFVVSPAGLLLTAYHVIDGASTIAVKCPGGDPRPVAVESKSPLVDLAVLKTTNGPPFKSYLPLSTTLNGTIGEHVFTVGYPVPGLLGGEPKFSEGTISAMSGPRGDASFLQVSVPVQPGNSGGALVNEKGWVLGVVVSGAAPAAFLKDTGTLPQNINWAVKATNAAPLLPGTATNSKSGGSNRERAIAQATASSCLVLAAKTMQPPPPRVPVPPPAGILGGVSTATPSPVRIDGSIKPPTKIKDVPPVYPAVAQSARVQGVVVIEATLGIDGSVTAAKILESIPLLDSAALDAVRQWQFTPTQMNGVLVPVIMTVTVNFNLQ